MKKALKAFIAKAWALPWERWVLVLPIASLAYLLFGVLSNLVGQLMRLEPDPISPYLMPFFQYSMPAWAFVWYGAHCAPRLKLMTGVALTVIYTILMTSVWTFILVTPTPISWKMWLEVAHVASSVITVFITCHYLHRSLSKKKKPQIKYGPAPGLN